MDIFGLYFTFLAFTHSEQSFLILQSDAHIAKFIIIDSKLLKKMNYILKFVQLTCIYTTPKIPTKHESRENIL